MDNVKKFDKAVQKEVDEYRRIKESRSEPVNYPVDPCEGDIWELQYTAERNGEEYPLNVDKELAFYAIIDGIKMGAQDLINEEYEIMNDADIVVGNISTMNNATFLRRARGGWHWCVCFCYFSGE